MSEKKPESPLKSWAKFSTVAIQMGVTIYLGNLLGSWLDGKFNTTFLEPAVTLLAVFLSMYVIIKAVKDLNS
ncbi:AtpZ/AtpI family protein [Leeuwenhoekiella palythoae]|uniref:F0F1-ATPase subunit (Ca2+/Mg2+ transporter) n=1 Tax=Leeuwenhoekiella palythoae TaxID=573501 RepID=A0A1M5VTN7_9FLAO|nr:AtpZ/AtpI family protein [Leeuwenhoekiella palythoae]RXG31063.1 putative F0F1-ATPase subunit (Ca2+/Mg2+ transporter) [Leeuwenhoekiella palythoae]SHH78591.1 Putative F0F1-ATPase subunit Ca2+/Mg2+ transporter [Leeuwenhoekiella palythoae]